MAFARILNPWPAIWEYLFLSPSYTIMISYISFLPYSDTATPFVPDFNAIRYDSLLDSYD